MRQPFRVAFVLSAQSHKTANENVNMEDIVQGCIRRDSFARQKLYEAFYGKMMAVCMRYASDREQAKDFLHDGFLKVFENIEKFSSRGSLEGWIKRIMVNNMLDYIRKNRKIFLTGDDQWMENEEISEDIFEDEAAPQPGKEEILMTVQQLPPAYRTVFNLYVMEDFSHKEIAGRLGISEGTSKSNLAKARIHLKKAISQIILKNEDTRKR